ncbi:cysteine--tRNA ligase [Halothermothrix orenii]|uniref:Cysteine--tRNA ligase n=1 Tax=Halothermothrix orenii (strain H 168 / OCM 544 / DSM 9562) TaxID=373903 RepID=B8D0A3_HALOH|nr:cysteine--tRNA ligase [Halothermothrix orenii]ACL68857.1 cysteinyl-tRNA synthetase [Halothermothrix orenii H 168]
MLRVYNTLSRKKEKFTPLETGKVRMYVCGLTVQNYAHIGHIRSAVNYDVIRRYLEYKGYEVTYVQNFTDINEKIVARAREEGLRPLELADKYTKAYLEDIEKMKIKRADVYCRATDTIKEIIKMVKKLLDKGYAYEVNGNVYFSVEKFSDYGKLSGRNLEEMQAGARVEVNEEKRHPMDFALWKKAPAGEISWDSPWGKGWPGWHIECSAMSIKYLGKRIDIHGGGTDLIFPHHENEIAQSESCTGEKPFVKYWLHNGSVNLKGEKMSKSLGNFFTVREILKEFKPDEVRYFLLTKHYRSPIDFNFEEVEAARKSWRKLVNTYQVMVQILEKGVITKNKITENTKGENTIISILNKKEKEFEEAMDDDFNTARATGVMHELAREINTFVNSPEFELNGETSKVLKKAQNLFDRFSDILGLDLAFSSSDEVDNEILNNLVDFILEIRDEARQEKNWQLADRIRDGLEDLGFEIKDTPHGVRWERK